MYSQVARNSIRLRIFDASAETSLIVTVEERRRISYTLARDVAAPCKRRCSL